MVVGKNIQFSVLYAIPNTKREYGVIFLNDGRRLPEEMVKDGWLKLREDAGRKEDSEEALQQLDKLRLLEATARSEDKGLWGPRCVVFGCCDGDCTDSSAAVVALMSNMI